VSTVLPYDASVSVGWTSPLALPAPLADAIGRQPKSVPTGATPPMMPP
jgi:hypothetical protein